MNAVKIKIFGFPEIIEELGASELEIKFEGNTFGALMNAISNKYGERVSKALLVQVMKNGNGWIDKNDSSIAANDGDTFSFFTMIAGG